MKEIRSKFTPEEYAHLQHEADRLNIPVSQLVHDRAAGISSIDQPLTATQILANEMSKNREVLNQIIRRESTADTRLYEDDLIRIEMAMAQQEGIAAAFIAEVLRKVG